MVEQQAEGWMRSGERGGDDEPGVLEVSGYERDLEWWTSFDVLNQEWQVLRWL